MLTVSGLHTRYGAVEALKGVDLEIAKGTVVSIVGANGAGKSTLINTISGVLPAARGRIRFEGREIANLPSHQVARRGLIQVPEGRQVLGPLSVRENLELGRQTLAGRAKGSDRLDEVLQLFPRLRERLTQASGSLSGGEQQMLAIGRALMGYPSLLLLDEPSLGLAPVIVSQVFDALRNLSAGGLTLLIVEQNVSRALDISSYAYVLERGRIARHGESKALAGDPAIRESYLGL